MRISIKATDSQKAEFLTKKTASHIEINFAENEWIAADVYFDLNFSEQNPDGNILIKDKIVFANAVTLTCTKLPENYVRINAWNGFLKRDILQCASTDTIKKKAMIILDEMQWQYSFLADEPGMISPRIISMIINEAYYALGENVSTKTEIDMAMKLGTNYPYGPFEWAEKIGKERIFFLLKTLFEKDKRYAIAPRLLAEINTINFQ